MTAPPELRLHSALDEPKTVRQRPSSPEFHLQPRGVCECALIIVVRPFASGNRQTDSLERKQSTFRSPFANPSTFALGFVCD